MKSKAYCVTVLAVVLGLISVIALFPATQAQSAQRKVVLEIRTSAFGSGAYEVGLAWEQIINKSGTPWLTATCQESLGGAANVMTVCDKLSAEKRGKTIFVAGASSYYAAKNKLKPFKHSYEGKLLGVALMGGVCVGFITLDPNINTPEDLVGKKVAFGPATHTASVWATKLFYDVWGLKGKVKIEFMTFPGSADALRDGLVDVCMLHSEIAKPVPIPRSAWKELVETQKDKFHFISVSKESVDKLGKILGYPVGIVEIPAKAYGAGQTKPAGTVNGYSSCWWAAADGDKEVVYEALKLAYDNVGKFKEYLGPVGAFDPQVFGEVPVTEAEMHPGAIKFYKEHGIKPGTM
jgi:TRAP transporter TAXI family solute receptor